MRKLLSLLLCVLLVGALVVPASAAVTDEFTVTADKTTVSPGDRVTLTVDAETVKACKSFGVLVEYNDSVFEVVSSECKGAGFGYPVKTTSADVEGAKSTWVGLGAININSSVAGSEAIAKAPTGTVGTIVLKVKNNAAPGVYILTSSAAVENDGTSTDAVVNNVTITVEEKTAGGLLGDANGDGRVTSRDATMILKYEVGMLTEADMEKFILANCDTTGEGRVSSRDATLILQYEVGLLEKFPAEK